MSTHTKSLVNGSTWALHRSTRPLPGLSGDSYSDMRLRNINRYIPLRHAFLPHLHWVDKLCVLYLGSATGTRLHATADCVTQHVVMRATNVCAQLHVVMRVTYACAAPSSHACHLPGCGSCNVADSLTRPVSLRSSCF